MLFRAKVHKCPGCGSYDINEEAGTSDHSLKPVDLSEPPTPPRPPQMPPARSTMIKTKPRLRGYIIPQTPTPLQGEQAITPELLKKSRKSANDDLENAPVETDDAPTNENPVDQRARVALELERALGESIGTDATVEIPNPLTTGLEFSSDVFLEDRIDPSVERAMPELRKDPSVEQTRPVLPALQPHQEGRDDDLDLESFGREPTTPRAKTVTPNAIISKTERQASGPPPPPKLPAPGADDRQRQFELEDSVIDDALSGLDFSFRDPGAGQRDPSLVLDLNNPLTEEEIALSKSLIKGERDVSTRPARREEKVFEAKVEVASEMMAQIPVARRSPSVAQHEPSAPRTQPPALPDHAGMASAREAHGTVAPAPRIGSRLSAIAAVFAFGAAAFVALMGSLTAPGGWMCLMAAAVVGAGTVLPRLDWRMNLLHAIAAGAAVASTQPWALDLAQIGQTSFWRAPAAMACVGALIVAVTLALAAAETHGEASR